jgi:uncharacterized membrane protein YkvA (DUF1232 family)
MSGLEIIVALVLTAAFLGILAYRILRATSHGRRFLRLPARAKVRFGRELLNDAHVSWPAKAVLVLGVGYLAMPFDLIPDFIPVLGQLDDVLVVALLLLVVMAAVPRDRFEAALTAAEQSLAKDVTPERLPAPR